MRGQELINFLRDPVVLGSSLSPSGSPIAQSCGVKPKELECQHSKCYALSKMLQIPEVAAVGRGS